MGDNKYHSQVVLTYKDDSQFVGEFKDGEPWQGIDTDYDDDGNIIEIAFYSDGEIADSESDLVVSDD